VGNPLQNFVNQVTVVGATWLNQVDVFINTLFNSATTVAQAQSALGVTATGQDPAYLKAANNLSDLTNTTAALASLGLTQSYFNAQLAASPPYAQTPAELAASVTPSNYGYTPGDIRRYGAVLTDLVGGVNVTAFTRAIAVAGISSGATVGTAVYIPPGLWYVNATLTVTGPAQVCFQGAGKFQSILYCNGFSSDVPVINYNGSSGSGTIDSISCRGFAIWDASSNARGITATWVKNSAFDDLYFYQLKNGWVGYTSFGNGFRNNNAYGITGDTYILSSVGTAGGCSDSYFEKCRFVGVNGVSVNFELDSLTFIGCDFEGIVGNGAAIIISPPTGSVCSAIVVEGCHFENVNGTALYMAGTDANSITGLAVKGNFIKGGFSDSGNASAVNAIVLSKVNGYDISNNNFVDWGTSDATGGGTQGYAIYQSGSATNTSNGVVENNVSAQSTIGGTSVRTVQNISDVALASSVRVGNNWAPVNGTGFLGYAVSYNKNTYAARAFGQFAYSGSLTQSCQNATVTRNSVGSYSVAFITAMPNANYAVMLTGGIAAAPFAYANILGFPTASGFNLETATTGGIADLNLVTFVVFSL
jgi:hypothetical protein